MQFQTVEKLLQENGSVPDKKDPLGLGFYQNSSVPADLLAPILVGYWLKIIKNRRLKPSRHQPLYFILLKAVSDTFSQEGKQSVMVLNHH